MRGILQYGLFLGFLIFLPVLAGCQTRPLTMNDLSMVQKGVNFEQLDDLLHRKPNKQVSFMSDRSSYYARFYTLQTGTQTTYTTVCNQYGCYPVPIEVPITSPYLFLFENPPRLMTWGFVEELHKSSEPRVVRLMTDLEEYLKNEKKH
jgi:hypothetical protein